MNTVRTVAKNTTALFFAEVVSLGASLVYFAVLARYIQADGVGAITAAQGLVGLLIVVANFGFSALIVRDVAASKARSTAYVSNVAFIRVLLLAVFGVLLYLTVHKLDYPQELAIITLLYGIAYGLDSISDIALCIFRAFEKMEYNMLVQIFRTLVNIGLSLGAIYLQYSLVVIVSISVLASLLKLFLAFWLLKGRFVVPHLELDLGLSKRIIKAAIPFGMTGLYPVARTQLNTVILSAVASMEVVGWFGASNSLITMIMMIPAVFMQAAFPVFSRLSTGSGKSLLLSYQKSFTYLFLLGLAISVGVFSTAHEIVPLVLGDGFEMAVPALRILAWLPLVGFVGFCHGSFLCATGREKLFMMTEGLFAIVYAVLALVLTNWLSYIGACYAILAPTAAGFVFYSVLCHRMLKLALPWKTLSKAALAALVMAGCVHYSLECGVNLFAVMLVLGPAVYGGALYLLRVFSAEDVLLFKQMLRLA